MAPTKKSTLAALAVLSLSSLAAASDVVVDDAPIVADAPAAVAAADAAPKKLTTAEKIAAVTPKTPWTPSTVKLPAGTLADQFPSVADFESNWVPSRSQKADVPAGSADNDKDQDLWRYRGEWKAEEPHTTKGSGPGDLGLVVSSPAAHHAISRKLPKPVEFKGKSTVTIQYEVKLQNGLECGGAYMKLLEKDAAFVPAQFSD
ncbi:Calreticulin family-domain-containing protein, partial [Blastocladiella britannica]